MKTFNLFIALLCAVLMAQPSWAAKKKDAGKKEKEAIVIGESLKVGMPLEKAISLLGTPKLISVKRGTEPEMDSISIEYLNHGVRIHALAKNTKIEELEVLPTFKGKFAAGVKIGAKYQDLMKNFGIPDSVNSHIAEYPDSGMYLFLKNDTLISAKLFAKNSKLLEYKLLKQ